MADKRPVGRPPNAPKEDQGGTNVTYVPRDGDLASTVSRGLTFQANKPTKVKDPVHLEQCKANPWFNVEGYDPAAAPVADDKIVPTDSEGYKRYAVAWFKTVQSSAEMKARWTNEEALRAACGVGSDDLTYLNSLYDPRLAELIKAES